MISTSSLVVALGLINSWLGTKAGWMMPRKVRKMSSKEELLTMQDLMQTLMVLRQVLTMWRGKVVPPSKTMANSF